ncbi:Wzz/FepE/Etk N-terminal domain-containing protein [Polaromonas sp.]|uniref:Wzz/FepE/Etk N-terminal domain-containing protein n=1 Tax=Polaromonas sp. TaxID=1869339 RepID=UPI0025CD78AD|nr:Wzz/FepE/Etk N-terminal domain-containing protein [Polaromonas sp.]
MNAATTQTEYTQLAMLDSVVVQDDEISLLDLLQVVAENLRLLVLVPLAAGLLALGVSFALVPTFTATTKFMPPQQQQSGAAAMLQSLGALGGLAGAASGLKNPADQYVSFLKSRSVQDALIDRFKQAERYDQKYRQDARSALAASVRVSSGKDGLISIDVDDKDPKFAATLANAYVEELGRLLNRLAVTEAQQRRLFFEKQLATAKDNLVKAEQALKASGVNSSALKASPQAAVEGLAKLKAAITAQEVKLASMRGYLTETAPDFKQGQTELAALRSQVARAEKEEPASGASGSDYIAKFRDFKYHETLFELFSKQYEMARLDESREGAVIQVVDVAQEPEKKSNPKRAVIVMGAVLAVGFFLLLFIFVRHALQGAAQDQKSIEKLASLRLAWFKSIGRA